MLQRLEPGSAYRIEFSTSLFEGTYVPNSPLALPQLLKVTYCTMGA